MPMVWETPAAGLGVRGTVMPCAVIPEINMAHDKKENSVFIKQFFSNF
jgi:hypothetical protein